MQTVDVDLGFEMAGEDGGGGSGLRWCCVVGGVWQAMVENLQWVGWV